MSKRTDIHRPGAIIPANYSYYTSYHLATTVDGWPVPPYNVELVLEMMATKSFVKTGGLGKCSICGSNYIYGDVWEHEPTGEYLHVGQDCAKKYELLADRSAFELEAGRAKAAAAKQAQKAVNREAREEVLKNNPGLAEAFEINNPVILNIKDYFFRYHTLSEKQVAVVLKIAKEATQPKEENEKTVAAPTGKHIFDGVVVSAKTHEGAYGISYKMTVKVTTPEGVWLAWGTVPNALLESVPYGSDKGRLQNLRGATVRIKATLEAGREPHFAFMKRPTGEIIRQSEVAELTLKDNAERRAEEEAYRKE